MQPTRRRKDEHIEICLSRPVGSSVPTGLDAVRFEHLALPEIDLDDVDLDTTILGQRLRAPLLLGAMTGGSSRARRINERLARAAERLGLGMALGSQRAMIEDPRQTGSYRVRDLAPELPLLIGNIGAVQLRKGVAAETLREAVRSAGADALAFHLNPLQEALQPEGDTCFRGLEGLLREAVPRVGVPCIVKEVGAGLSFATARRLATLPLAGVEAAGVGGTSWARVEAHRAGHAPAAVTGERLAGWGVPTAESIIACRRAFGRRLVIGSGGVRTGRDVAAAIALGADACALAGPLLGPAQDSEAAVVHALEAILLELRVVMFCTGCRRPVELRRAAGRAERR
ncbi:MAG: type 2 isopentenyl-diphosphate Delta-isomerase [Deltaproteobacteria bacterium]|nr:type 2 isopentenyl-diphosphate Delta-isomerase [Deltaproteobacteria bacterium]